MYPIIFIHWSDSSYLKNSLQQASYYGNVILLKDIETNIKSFEIARWFVLRDYLISNKIKKCLYLDSDVMLYKKVFNEFSEYDLALSKAHCGHVMFINNINALIDFCNYINDNKIEYHILLENTRRRIKDGVFSDAVGDMVFINNFINSSNYNVGNTALIIDNSTYDHNINVDDSFDMENSIKKITFVNNIPYGNRLGELIRFNSLHFQGSGCKYLMKDYVKQRLMGDRNE